MDQGALVVEQTEAGADFVRRFDKYAPVKVAFWAKGSEENRWYLYVASDQFDDANLDLAYGEVLRLAEEIGNPNFDPFLVKLIATANPLAQAAVSIHARFPGHLPTRFGGNTFGDRSMEGVYIYPTSVTALAS